MDQIVRAGVDLVALTRGLVDIDSTTGREGEAGRWLGNGIRRRDAGQQGRERKKDLDPHLFTHHNIAGGGQSSLWSRADLR